MKKAFTLIELLLVISLIAIVSTIAVTKVGSVRESSARKISLANQSALGRAVEAYLVANPGKGIERLDNLMNWEDSVRTDDGSGFMTSYRLAGSSYPYFYRGPDDTLGLNYREKNSGLTPNLYNNVLIPYSLSAKEATVLQNHGYRYSMSHWTDPTTSPFDGSRRGADGAYPTDDATIALKPHESACLAVSNQTRMVVAAVNPFSTEGREIYRDAGMELLNLYTNRTDYAIDTVKAEVRNAGGALLVFGLGQDASIIGSPSAGLDSVPTATYPLNKYYRQYLLLFRIDTSTNKGSVVFCGVLDPCGFSIRQAKKIVDNL